MFYATLYNCFLYHTRITRNVMDIFDSSVADLGFRSKTGGDAGIQSLTLYKFTDKKPVHL